jgi:hypothetical protein
MNFSLLINVDKFVNKDVIRISDRNIIEPSNFRLKLVKSCFFTLENYLDQQKKKEG